MLLTYDINKCKKNNDIIACVYQEKHVPGFGSERQPTVVVAATLCPVARLV